MNKTQLSPTDNGKDNKICENNTITTNPYKDKVFPPITVVEFQDDIDKMRKELEEGNENKGILKVKTANQWIEQAKKTPIPEMLFSEFWHENEICILFADTNLGKSVLAVQIANSISNGKQIPGFKVEAKQQPVLYFDFELSAKQFEARYSIKNEMARIYDNHYLFNDSFKRIEINPDAEIPESESFENNLNQSIEQSIIDTQAKVLIIDNITYLKNETEKAKDALPLMKQLKALKNRHNLSILTLAHTPKRDLSKPITRNDLQGSKMLINFVDSAFAIGESQTDKSIRYLKQIKARNTEIVFDTENIVVCQIQKPFNFLEFEFMEFGTEREYLKQISETDREQLEQDIIELKTSEPTMSYGDMAKRLGTNKMRVKRTIDRNKA